MFYQLHSHHLQRFFLRYSTSPESHPPETNGQIKTVARALAKELRGLLTLKTAVFSTPSFLDLIWVASIMPTGYYPSLIMYLHFGL